MDLKDVAKLLAVRSEMADLRKDLLAARYQIENALEALKEGNAEAVERHLQKVQKAIEQASKRTHLPEEFFYRRLPRSAAARVFKDGAGKDRS